MDRYTVVVHYADGTRSAIGTHALSFADARQEIIARLAEQCIEWPPHCCPQHLAMQDPAETDYCPACLDDAHVAPCPNLTRTGF
jgi:hypothetical protein